MFNTQFTESLIMYWRTGDAYVDGVFQEGTTDSATIVGSVQRLNMREVQRLPEGFRASETIKIYTEESTIRLLRNNRLIIQEGAEFLWNGKRYAMIGSEKWEYLIPHWKITCVLKSDSSVAQFLLDD